MNKETIAVHCKTEEEFKAVNEKAHNGKPTMCWSVAKTYEDICIYLAHSNSVDKKIHCERDGYTIIPASEYLREEEFKVGDRVVCIKATDDKHEAVGELGTIIGCHALEVSVEFDRDIGGHACFGYEFEGKDRHCWNLKRDGVRLANQPKTTKEEEIKLDDLTDVQQEELCALCEAILETDRSRCEANIHRCNQAFEMYLEEINPNEKEESTMEIKSNFIEVFNDDAKLAAKMSKRFGDQYSNNTDRDLIALERDKEKLVQILEAEEGEEGKTAAKEE